MRSRGEFVGLVGAVGLMARQLAPLALRRLELIVLRDLTESRSRTLPWIRDELAELVRKGRLGKGKARFLGSLVSGGTGWEVFGGCDLVLEAVFEEMAVKKEVFAELERVVSLAPGLATNTSSLSVTEMGADLEHPERVKSGCTSSTWSRCSHCRARSHTAHRRRQPPPPGRHREASQARRACWDAPAFVVNRLLGRQGSIITSVLDLRQLVDETDEAVLRLGLPMAPSVLLQPGGAQGREPRTPHAA